MPVSITLFGAQDCEDTARTRADLQARSVPFHEVNIANDPTAEHFVIFINPRLPQYPHAGDRDRQAQNHSDRTPSHRPRLGTVSAARIGINPLHSHLSPKGGSP